MLNAQILVVYHFFMHFYCHLPLILQTTRRFSPALPQNKEHQQQKNKNISKIKLLASLSTSAAWISLAYHVDTNPVQTLY